MLQTDGGYLGSDFEAFFSAVVSGAAGIYVGVLLRDAGIETDLVVRPDQRVRLSGDPSLPRPPRWGGGSLTVQQRGSLSLESVEMPAVRVMSGGELSLSRMAVPYGMLVQLFFSAHAPGSVVRLSEVTVPDSWQGPATLAGSATGGADGALACDPPDLCSVRASPLSPLRPPLPCNAVSERHRHENADAWLGANAAGTQALDYADSYTLSGCRNAAWCGVFTRVEAHCAAGSGARCPGGASAAGNAYPTLCDGAPVYQQNGDGYVLLRLRVSEAGGGTRWYVSDDAALGDCAFHGNGVNPRSDLNPGRLGYGPTVPGYGQWSTPRNHESIRVVAGGGR